MGKTRRIKRTVTMLMAVLMVVSLLPTLALAAEDISSHWAVADITYLKDKNIISGDENGNINPDVPITRAEFVTMVNRAFGYTAKASTNFPDVEAGAWYADAFLIAKQAGYVKGDENGNATPDRPITRAEVAVVCARILELAIEGSVTGFADQDEIPEWAAPSIVAAKIAGLVTGYTDNTFRAGANLSRAEGFTLIAKILRVKEQEENGDNGNDGNNSDDGQGGQTVQPDQKIIIGAAGYSVEIPGAAGYSVNYALVSSNVSSGVVYKWNGGSVSSSKVSTDGKTVKIEIPAGNNSGILSAVYNGETVLSKALSFTTGKAAPDTIYGTVSMSFSEFYHDVTAASLPAYGTTTFAENGTVATPEKFITGGTRTGGSGTDTYAVADTKAKVDAVSSATYGDDVHFVPNKNLTLNTDDAGRKNKPSTGGAVAAEILGITKAEVEVSFDLYANAALLAAANRETAQSENVIAKLGDDFELISIKKGSAYVDDAGADITGAGVYAPKKMLVDGNWGARAETPLDAAAVKALPGEGVFIGDVAYGGNWGDYLIDCSFVDEGNTAATVLGPDYAGAAYFDNFIEYMYGGYIEDENGNVEPLVFLQNLFSHRMHEDFDVAISPSRFSRLNNLTIPGEYTVTVLVWGFEDVKFTFEIDKTLVNASVAIEGATSAQVQGTTPVEFTITGLDDAAEFAANAEMYKGNNPAGTNGTDYELTVDGDSVKLTITATYLGAGNYWGAHSLRYEDSDVIYKNVSFTLVNGVVPTLEIGNGRTTPAQAGTEADPIEVTKADAKLFFSDGDFANGITIGARGGSNFRDTDATAATALAAGTTFMVDAADSYIDLSNAAFEVGKIYVFTVIAAGFNTQTYYAEITA